MMRYGCNLIRGGGAGKGGGSSHGYELRRVEGCEEALAGARRPPVALVVVEHLAQQRDGLLDGLGGGHGGAERRPRRGDDAGVEVDGPAAGRGGEERLARGPGLDRNG